MDRLKELLEKIPYSLILLLGLGYIGYGYYDFRNSAESPLIMKTSEGERLQKENDGLTAKLKSAQEFYRTLDQKRVELRKLAQQLDEMKATLSDQLDVPSLIKLFVTEAAKVGLSIQSIRPLRTETKDYYAYQSFGLEFRSVYVQLLVFLERLSTVERIVSIDMLQVMPQGGASLNNQYVELQGSMELRAYKYMGSKADMLGRADATGGTTAAPGAAKAPGGAK